MKKLGFVVSLITVAFALNGAVALADSAYHTENLPLTAANGHPELRSGQVVNIHPNGPVNYAHERYMVNGADPNATYQVVIEIHADENCDDIVDVDHELPTAVLNTNAQGNGHASVTFSPEDVEDFQGATIFIRWSLRVDSQSGEEAYGTACTEVVLDVVG